MSYNFLPPRGKVNQEKHTKRKGLVPSSTPLNETELSSLTALSRGLGPEREKKWWLVLQVNKKRIATPSLSQILNTQPLRFLNVECIH